MKIIDEKKTKTMIILDEGDTVEISSFYGNDEHLLIKCLGSSIHVDELSISKIKEKSLEEKEIKKMKNYLKNKK